MSLRKSLFLLTAFSLVAALLPALMVMDIANPPVARAMTGSGTAGDPYIIYNLTDLQAVRYMDMSAYYELGNDIDASASTSMRNGCGLLTLTSLYEDNDRWESGPTADNGTTGSWTLTPADGVYYTKLDDFPAFDDTNYITTGTNGSRVLLSYEGFNIPAGSTVLYITVFFRIKEALTGTTATRACIQVAGTVYNSSTSNGYNYWNAFKQYWVTNPETGLGWTVDEINGVSDNCVQLFGCEVTDASPSVSVSQVWMSVTYTAPTPSSGDPFTGHFDGKGHKISNLRMYRRDCSGIDGNSYQGLFGMIDNNTVIQNLTLENVDMYFGIGSYSAFNGALAGYLPSASNNVTISNCHMSGTLVTCQNSGGLLGGMYGEIAIDNCTASVDLTCTEESGGLIGWLGWAEFAADINSSNMTNCSSSGNITIYDPSGGDIVGGLVGWVDTIGVVSDCSSSVDIAGGCMESGGLIGFIDDGTVTDCYATGDIESRGMSGGLIGVAFGGLNTVTIEQCYATGDVTEIYGDGDVGGFVGLTYDDTDFSECFSTGSVECTVAGTDSVGGFAGNNSGVITDCYARGDVITVDATDYDIGGFVGCNVDTVAEIINCYSTGLITTPSVNDVGGFCGDNRDTITDCFWDYETSGYLTSDGGAGRSSAAMKVPTTFPTWDFTSTWDIITTCNDSYPCLRDTTPLCVGASYLRITRVWVTVEGELSVDESTFEEALRLAIPIIFFFAVLVGGLLITFRHGGGAA